VKILLVKTDVRTGLELDYVPPLGILHLAAVAEELGCEVRTVDLRLEHRRSDLRRRLDEAVDWRPELVGLSGLSAGAQPFQIVADFFRRRLPSAVLFGGGPYVSSENGELLLQGVVDYCVVGEGESVFQAALERLARGESFDDLPGLSLRRDGAVVENEPRRFVENLDTLPFPAWRHHDFHRARGLPGFANFASVNAAIFSSRGCPFHCIFCHDLFGRRFRARSPENVLGEVGLLRSRYGVKLVEFVDDIFNFDRDRAVAILRGIAERYRGLGITFPNGLRGDLLDEEVIYCMKEAGCRHTAIGVETASERLQKVIRKNVDFAKLKENLRLLRKHHIYVEGFFVLGFPTETLAEAQATARFALESDIDYPLLFLAMPYNKKGEMNRMISPERFAAAEQMAAGYDYRWGNVAFGEAPYAELEKIQMTVMRRRVRRLRNIPRFLSVVKGILFRLFFRRDFVLVGWFFDHFALLGSGDHTDDVKKRRLAERQAEMDRLAEALRGPNGAARTTTAEGS
jgi:radical SAM superfamily enzyme YgiQ (UPF0313 family)